MKKINFENNVFLLFLSLLALVVSDFVKIKVNFLFQNDKSKVLLEVFDLNVWLFIFLFFTLIIVFISAMSTSVYIKILSNIDKSVLNHIKTNVYLIYILSFVFVNSSLSLYMLLVERELKLVEINVINIFSYGVLSVGIYLLIYKVIPIKRAITISFTIFLLNSIIAFIYIINYI